MQAFFGIGCMVVDWFTGREVVTALAIILACRPLSIAVALVGETALTLEYGWRMVMTSIAVLSVLAFRLVATLYRDSPSIVTRPSEQGDRALSSRETVASGLAGLLWGTFNVGLVIFYSFTAALLMQQGWHPLNAGSATSVGLWITMVSLPLGSWLVETRGRPGIGIVLSCMIAGLAMMLLPTTVWQRH
jgi:hypothetical protein